MRRAELIRGSLTQITACASLQYWPKFDESKLQPTVATGYVVSARYLRDPPCFLTPEQRRGPAAGESGELVICMDPPPIALTFQVDEVLYGRIVPSRITVVTTSHYGTESFSRITRQPLVMLIHTDGKYFELPRYRYDRLSQLRNGQWALPVLDPARFYGYFPCDLTTEVRRLEFQLPRPFLSFRGDPNNYRDEIELAKSQHATIKRDGIFIQQGLTLEAIADIFEKARPTVESVGCNESN